MTVRCLHLMYLGESFDPFLLRIEKERNFLGLFLCVVERWSRHCRIFCFDTIVLSFWNETTFGYSWFWSQNVVNRFCHFILAWTWHYVDWLHRSYWKSESIEISLCVNLASALGTIKSWLKVLLKARFIKHSMQLVSSRLWMLVFLVFWWCVRIIQVDRHNLLLDSVNELVAALVLFLVFDIEAVLSIVLPWSRHLCKVLQLPFVDNTPHWLWHEDILRSFCVFLNYLRVILAYSWGLLFEVNVHCDRLHIVQRVVLVERQTEITFVVHARSRHMTLRLLWLVLTRSNCYAWVRL